MPQATAQHLRDEGWRVEQFGGALTPMQFDAYLDAVCIEAGRWAGHYIGSADYAALPANSYATDCVRRAEVLFCNARLWKRRAAFFDSGAAHNEQHEYLERREYLKHAEDIMACAESALTDAMRALGLPVDGIGADWAGMASGIVETGPLPPTQVAA